MVLSSRIAATARFRGVAGLALLLIPVPHMEAQTASTQGGQSRAGGWLGIHFSATVTQETGRDSRTGGVVLRESFRESWVRVEGVVPGSAAHAAGIRPGDLIVEVNGAPASLQTVSELAGTIRVGEVVTLRLQRAGGTLTVRPVARPRPDDPPPPPVVSVAPVLVDSLLAIHFRNWEEQAGGSPLAPLVLGQNAVAGARLTPVDPDLADYFRVDRGLLVTEVVPGSPAGESGLRGGDVVVAVNGEAVSSVAAFRSILTGRSEPAALDIVRAGRTQRLQLR